jgi:hypothetical protein
MDAFSGHQKHVRIYECTIMGCDEFTFEPTPSDPRQRWMVDLHLSDERGLFIVTFCPAHVKALMNLTEEFFERLERTEKLVQSARSD